MIKNTITAAALVCSLVALALCIYSGRQQKTYIYVDTLKLYSDFEYTRQMNKALEGILSARRNIMDSMYQSISLRLQEAKSRKAKSDAEMTELSRLQEDYFYKKEQFEKDNQATASNYSSKVWNQINELVSKYGRLNNYGIIFGANGQGTIMYGEQGIDKTQEVLDYLNKQFNDKG